MANQLVPFGKYKGQPLEVLLSDTQYMTWLSEQPWVKDKYPVVQTLIINNFGEPDETPEHNGLQARFYEARYVNSFFRHVFGCGFESKKRRLQIVIDKKKQSLGMLDDAMSSGRKQLSVYSEDFPELSSALREINEWTCGSMGDFYADLEETKKGYCDDIDNFSKKIEELESFYSGKTLLMERNYRVASEELGWDVLISLTHGARSVFDTDTNNILIELKPQVGDDFPAILRQLKNNRDRNENFIHPSRLGRRVISPMYYGAEYWMVYTEYTGCGTSEQIMRKQFESSGFHVAREDEYWPALSSEALLHGMR